MTLKQFPRLFWDAAASFLKDGAADMAASIAYYALFSLFPLLLALIFIGSLFLTDIETVQDQLLALIVPVLPQSATLVRDTVEGVILQRRTAGLIASISLLWSGTQIFAAISVAVNRAWDLVEKRTFVHKLLLRFVLLIGIGLLFLISFGLSIAVAVLSNLNIVIMGFSLFSNPFWGATVGLVPVLSSFLMFLFVYKVVPDTTVSWGPVVAGAIVASILFEISKHIFVVYIERFSTFNLVYGSISGVIVLLFWVYISASILLYGAELTRVISRNIAKEP